MKETSKKITKATFKSFIKKNHGKLFVKFISDFDGMQDMVDFHKNPQFKPATHSNRFEENSLGVEGVWLVSGSRDRFSAYEDTQYIGIKYYNCCGSAIVAIEK